MFLTTHAAAGIALSRYINDPWALFGISFAAHFAMDFIPHGDENLYGDWEFPGFRKIRKAIIVNSVDLVALTGLALWAVGQPSVNSANLMLVAIIGSLLPDFFSNFFPMIHQRMSWLFLVRWLYAITKPIGLRYVVRAQDWLHRVLHHEIIRRDIPLSAGIVMQLFIILAVLNIIA